MPHPNDTRRITKTSLFSWIFYRNVKLQVLALLVTVAIALMRVLPLDLQKRIINEAIGMKDLDKLFLYVGLFIAFRTAASGLKYVMNLMQIYIGERTLVTIRTRLYEHLLSLPIQFYRRTSPGNVIAYLVTEFIPVATFIGQSVTMPAVNLFTFFGVAGYLFYLNPELAALSISVYVVQLFVLPQIQKHFRRANRVRMQHTQELSGLVGEAVSGVHEVHSNASIPLESRKFGVALNNLYKATIRMNAYKFGIKAVNNLFQNMGPFVLFLVGGYLAIKGRFDLGSLVAYLAAYDMIYDPWKELMEFWQVYQDSSVRYRQIMRSFDHAPEFEQCVQGREPYVLDNDLEIRDLTYVVGGNIKLLDRVNVSVRGGEHVALVGFSGSGKSTLALCVAQLYRYSGGNVLLGGHEVSALSKQDITYNLGMVAQHPFIFDGTVRDNLLYSCEALGLQGGSCADGGDPSLDKLIETIQQVGLFLDVLSFGLRSRLDPEEDRELVGAVINARAAFQAEHADGLTVDVAGDIEFFDRTEYSRYLTVAENIAFGAPLKQEFDPEHLHANPVFVEFMDAHGLRPYLVSLGSNLARRTVDALGPEPTADMFGQSPVPESEYETYRTLAIRLDSDEPLSANEEGMLVKLGLRFVPGLHKLAGMSSEFMRMVVDCRDDFGALIRERDPDAFSFFDQSEYIHNRSIQDNILFGRVRADSAGAEERVSQRMYQLLIMEGVLEPVVEMGLLFQVGSMGDRLSGGQRQKIALARTFLKNPAVIILDEATAALDNKSQTRVQNIITSKLKGKSTVIAVIHRLDVLRFYDKVVVLKAGRVVEQGGYEELMEKKGALHELVQGRK
ncbi:ABC transporter transmembrane domain-containing protein [Pseudodesulfovibrio tunisiensis]|uniref:ABC transporter transmembrane domain-containing protein n=1 Tax=Pseudodesulfovibrio tunisiensis TaxID=463192 RepID=UPI001FB25335|nr:ABC transporter ATP-binding protein/permease [Pseudodesulfovibrio tunisiensis]